jgi:hypothetical protein
MTKKHFIALAEAIRNSESKFNQNQLNVLARFCQSQNYNFNWELWMDYIAGKCGPNGGKV